jgi:hypothetical protein
MHEENIAKKTNAITVRIIKIISRFAQFFNTNKNKKFKENN